jgi:ubiquinone/menaquinone biosynthesis C-methylase UbiE
MSNSIEWRQVWEDNSKENVGDFELDRGMSPRGQEVEALSEREHIEFIGPDKCEAILDAGCGTGVNLLRLHSRVRKIIGIDYASGSLQRCRRRIQIHQIQNAHVCLARLTAIPLPDNSVNKILCLSVLQYLDNEEVRCALKEFVRILAPGGIIILHVKNSSSLYWSTLRTAKKIKALFGRTVRGYHVRSFRWYANELSSLNCRVLDYKSFNMLTLDVMPRRLVCFLQRFELRHQAGFLFRFSFVRRHGADLKIKAVVCRPDGPSETASISPLSTPR